MAVEPVADTPLDNEPDLVGTPEGDNEFPTDQPLREVAEGLQTPRGNAPGGYRDDRPTGDVPEAVQPEKHEMGVVEKVIDEISHGTLLP